ncbi:MAGE-like protein 2 isoform X2 [Haliotis rufescens]|nr:MAGE-like protein 2 isoform X2 [Haliotis rufescens]
MPVAALWPDTGCFYDATITSVVLQESPSKRTKKTRLASAKSQTSVLKAAKKNQQELRSRLANQRAKSLFTSRALQPSPSSNSHQPPSPSTNSHQPPSPSTNSHQPPSPSNNSHQTPSPSTNSHQTPSPSTNSHQPSPSTNSHHPSPSTNSHQPSPSTNSHQPSPSSNSIWPSQLLHSSLPSRSHQPSQPSQSLHSPQPSNHYHSSPQPLQPPLAFPNQPYLPQSSPALLTQHPSAQQWPITTRNPYHHVWQQSPTPQLTAQEPGAFTALLRSCEDCPLKEVLIQTLQTELNLWRDRALKAEEEVRELQTNVPDTTTKPPTYKPLRGVQVPRCHYVQLRGDDKLPSGYQLLTQGASLAVPITWYAHVMSKSCNVGDSGKLKRFMDGFFEPSDVGQGTAAMFKRKHALVLQALEIFATERLKLLPNQFSDALSKKICTLRNAFRRMSQAP